MNQHLVNKIKIDEYNNKSKKIKQIGGQNPISPINPNDPNFNSYCNIFCSNCPCTCPDSSNSSLGWIFFIICVLLFIIALVFAIYYKVKLIK